MTASIEQHHAKVGALGDKIKKAYEEIFDLFFNAFYDITDNEADLIPVYEMFKHYLDWTKSNAIDPMSIDTFINIYERSVHPVHQVDNVDYFVSSRIKEAA